MESLSRLRGKRIFHPHGVGFAGRIELTSSAEPEIPAFGNGVRFVARLSRSAGLPEWLADPCGLALRVPDAYGVGRHQDLLMVSSASAPVVRHAILPSKGFLDRPYSTLLPYRFQGKLVLIGALPIGDRPGPTLAELAGREDASIEFDLRVATLGGPWRRFARLILRERVADIEVENLDLDPTNTGGGLELAGAINRLRGPSYRGSQAGRGVGQANKRDRARVAANGSPPGL